MDKRDISEFFTVELDDPKGIRADRYVAEYLELLSRSQVKTRKTRISLNSKEVKLSRILCNGDYIKVEYNNPEPLDILPEKLEFEIIYEDENSIVINKPQGMVVHPGAGNFTGTLVHGLLHHCLEIKALFPDNDLRPGVVHRLDKDTSGVIIAAKNPDALEYLSSQFRNRITEKTYLALVKGVPLQAEGMLKSYITRDPVNRKRFTVSEEKGKEAVTRYRVLKSWDKFSLILLKPETGRTHQLRVHMQHMGNPIIGDPIYSRRVKDLPDTNLMLHAYKLSIILPGSEKSEVFISPVPHRFQDLVKQYADPEGIDPELLEY